MSSAAKAGNTPAKKGAVKKGPTDIQAKIIKINEGKVGLSKGMQVLEKDHPEYYNSLRKENFATFKDEIHESIVNLEIKSALINIEEKLANCGNVGYQTESEAIGNYNMAVKNKELMEVAAIATMSLLAVSITMFIARRRLFLF